MEEQGKEILYHYTSLDGFDKILSSGALALTDIIKSNDPSEGYYALQMLEKSYKNLYRDDKIGRNDYIKYHTAFFEFSRMEKSFGRLQQVILSISFCQPVLPLVLWRTYGDNGSGVAIAVSKTTLDEIAEQKNFEFKRIEYLSEKELLERYSIFWKNQKDADESAIVDALKEKYLEGYFIKHPENSFEKEYRLVYTGLNLGDYTILSQEIPEKICSFKRNNDIVLYYKLPISGENKIIDYVQTGPLCKISDNEMRFLLNKYNIQYYRVTHDNIAMR